MTVGVRLFTWHHTPRSFDIDCDQHPVKFVLQNLSDSLLPAIQTWLVEMMPGFPEPQRFAMPEPRQ